MKLYGHPMSTCTRKVLCTLAEKGVNADFVTVDIMSGQGKTPEHLARQPFGQVPAIDDNGFSLYESRAIMRYLDETLPGTKLTPADPKQKATMEQWISVEASNFSGPAMKVVFQTFFNPMMGRPLDNAVLTEGQTGVTKALTVLDKRLGEAKYLAGDQFTIADITYLPYLEYLYAGGQGNLVEAHPNVSRWWKACSERPSWQKATGKNAA